MFWIIYFTIYVFMGILLDKITNSLLYRLIMALYLLFWPLFIVLAMVEVIRERK